MKFKKLNHDQIVAMANGTKAEQNREPFNRTAWYKAPEGLKQFETPKQEVVVKMDVLNFPLNGLMNKDLLDSGTFDTREMVYWNQSVMVHESFPESIVCNKTFDIRRASNDSVCTWCWDNKDVVDYRKATKRYTLMLLRIHPNEALGITDYTYMYSLDSHGKFAKAIAEAWGKASKRNDTSKMFFYEWDECGCSLEVFFSKQTSPVGFEFWGTNDVSFVPRSKPLTDEDVKFISELNLCDGIVKPTEEEYQAFLEKFSEKAPQKNGTVAPVNVTPTVKSEPTVHKTYEAPPETVVTKDDTFAKPVDDPAFDTTGKDAEEDFWK